MVLYQMGASDPGGLGFENLDVLPVLLPLNGLSYRTNFSSAGGSTTMIVPGWVGTPDAFGVGKLTGYPFASLKLDQPFVDILPSLLGGLRLDKLTLIEDRVLLVLPAVVGVFSVQVSLQGAIFVVPLLLGDLPIAVTPIPTPDFLTGPNGERPCLPWQVASTTVQHINDLTEDGGVTYKFDDLVPFVVTDQYDDDPDNPLTVAGGKAGFVGLVIDTPQGKALRFRPPYAGEVIVRTTDTEVFRWDEAAALWRSYITLPQRALNGQQSFQMLDPDGIWDYYAKMLGLMMAQHNYDTKRLLDLVDPASCPDEFLSLLMANFGADDFFFERSPEGKREVLRTFINLMQIKGTPSAITQAIRLFGFEGYGTHVWVIPQGLATDIIEKPFGYDRVDPQDGTIEFFPSSQINLHIQDQNGDPLPTIDDGTKQQVAEFMRRNVLPAHVIIKWFGTDHNAGEDTVGVADGITVTGV